MGTYRRFTGFNNWKQTWNVDEFQQEFRQKLPGISFPLNQKGTETEGNMNIFEW